MYQVYQRNNVITIGRKQCDIEIDSPYISKFHCKIVDQDLFDLDSVNGIYVNQVKVKQCKLQNGDYLSIGFLHLIFLEKVVIIQDHPDILVHLDKESIEFHLQPPLDSLVYPVFELDIEPPPKLKEEMNRSFLLTIGPSISMSIVMMITAFYSQSKTALLMPLTMLISMTLFPYLSRKKERKKIQTINQSNMNYYHEYLHTIEEKINTYINELTYYYNHDHTNIHTGIGDYPVVLNIHLPHMDFNKSPLEKELLHLIQLPRSLKHLPKQDDLTKYSSIKVVGKYRKEWILYCIYYLQEKKIQVIVEGIDCIFHLNEFSKKIRIVEDHYDLLVEANELFFPIIDENMILRKYSKEHQAYTLLDAMQVNQIDEYQLPNLPAYHSLKAIIGHYHNEPIYIDLHMKGNGPHGLLAGMTGSGKSELLITLILMLSLNYSPEYLSFLLIDFKGGGLTELFNHRLPHLANCIDNLDQYELTKGIYGLKNELERRERIFNEVREKLNIGKMDIDEYQRLYEKKIVYEPLTHIVMIVDEFAELKVSHPKMIDELIRIARIGRSLGFHLLLTTQKPSGVVSSQIWSNTNYSICMKVQDPGDSMEVIHRKDGADLARLGEMIIQTNQQWIFGDVLYLGRKYVPRKEIRFLDLNEESEVEEYEVLLSYIQDNCTVSSLPIWKPSLNQTIDLNTLPKYVVGIIDDYIHSIYQPIQIDLNRGNCLIIGKEGEKMIKAIQYQCSDLLVGIYQETMNFKEWLSSIQTKEGMIIIDHLEQVLSLYEYDFYQFIQQTSLIIVGKVNSIQEVKYQYQKYFETTYIFNVNSVIRSENLHLDLNLDQDMGMVKLKEYCPFRIGVLR